MLIRLERILVELAVAELVKALFLGDAKGKLTYAPELLIDKREDSGMSLGRQLLVADYNNDGILDFYIADTAVGTHNGFRDSYFLSQPNGTWLESSKTHLSHSNFVVFDHGGATGDIDKWRWMLLLYMVFF